MSTRAASSTATETTKLQSTVLLAVEPVVLEGALAVLIKRAQFAEVVEAHSSVAPFRRCYDAAVVSIPRPKGLRARVTIELAEGGTGRTRVRKGRTSRWETVSSHHDILQIIGRYCSPT